MIGVLLVLLAIGLYIMFLLMLHYLLVERPQRERDGDRWATETIEWYRQIGELPEVTPSA